MLGMILFFVIGIAGVETKKLSWKPFVILGVLTIPAIALGIVTKAPALRALGESPDYLYEPTYIATACMIQWVIWSAVYLLGYGFGKWRRGRKQDDS
ncbi:MAG: hypothetical protein ACKOUT_14225 [Novosphingobium sp.]